jgi:deoxycytidylate deaminase
VPYRVGLGGELRAFGLSTCGTIAGGGRTFWPFLQKPLNFSRVSFCPEIIIGLVGASGTPLDRVAEEICESMGQFGYFSETIRLSELLDLVDDLYPKAPKTSEGEVCRLNAQMDRGRELRRKTRHSALASLAIAQIQARRKELTGSCEKPLTKHCFILGSLKHTKEVEELRSVYGSHFILLGAFTPKAIRTRLLSKRIANSLSGRLEDYRSQAEQLATRDQQEIDEPSGQQTAKTFPLADAFVVCTPENSGRLAIDRIFNLAFQNPSITPTMDELGMANASAAAKRSGALGRQVGACILSSDCDVLAIGHNEVPKAGGGQYSEADPNDARDFAQGKDSNTELRRQVMRNALHLLKNAKWLHSELQSEPVDQLVSIALGTKKSAGSYESGALRNSLLEQITEFGRDIHAEMAALTTSARLGIRISAATLYSTTFPCHNCARHIIGAGITRVVFRDPYPKSYASELHADSIVIEGDHLDSKLVRFEPFIGVAPRRYSEWFDFPNRKSDHGKKEHWEPKDAGVWFGRSNSYYYVDRETWSVHALHQDMKQAKLTLKSSSEDSGTKSLAEILSDADRIVKGWPQSKRDFYAPPPPDTSRTAGRPDPNPIAFQDEDVGSRTTGYNAP